MGNMIWVLKVSVKYPEMLELEIWNICISKREHIKIIKVHFYSNLMLNHTAKDVI